MTSLLQNMLEMLPESYEKAEETLGAPEGILPAIAKILYLALNDCMYMFFCFFFFNSKLNV